MSLIPKDTENLILDVAKGNPGAITVIKGLMYFTKWHEMMKWCQSNLSGSNLWEKYKDTYHCDVLSLGKWIETQLTTTKEQPNEDGR